MFYHHSEDGGEGVAKQPGERALVVIQLAPDPCLGRGLGRREGKHRGRSPRVHVGAVLALRHLLKLWALLEV